MNHDFAFFPRIYAEEEGEGGKEAFVSWTKADTDMCTGIRRCPLFPFPL